MPKDRMSIFDLDRLVAQETDHKYRVYEARQVEAMRDARTDEIRHRLECIDTKMFRIEKLLQSKVEANDHEKP